MSSILAIARNTFREAIRDRILYVFLAFAVLLIIGSRFISMLTIGDTGKIIKDVGLFSIQMFGMLIAVMMSVMMVSREFEHRTVFTILAKPVSRLQYLLGKFFGLLAIIFSQVLLMTLALILIVFIYQLEFDPMLLFGAAMIFLELFVLCAFAMLFATVTKPILGSLLTLICFVVGHVTNGLWLLADRINTQIGYFFISIIYYILPNLELFNFKAEVVHHLAIPWAAVLLAVLYALVYSALLLFLAWNQFRNKDLE